MEYLSVKQTASYLQISVSTVWRYLKDGKLESTKIGDGTNGTRRISMASIEALIKRGSNGYHE